MTAFICTVLVDKNKLYARASSAAGHILHQLVLPNSQKNIVCQVSETYAYLLYQIATLLIKY